MTTIGQRIKNFRKSCGLSQAELAGKIGVTSQTVSKWECDVGLPDIIQIVPLAEVLDVSTDAILGANANMERNIENAIAAVEEKWKDGIDNQSKDRTDMHKVFDYYLAYRELFRRYPTNYEIALRGATYGSHLIRHIGRGLPEIEGFAAPQVFRDVEKMCRAIIAYDDDIMRKIEAKGRLILVYYAFGEREKADEELAGLPDQDKKRIRYFCLTEREGGEARVNAAKDGFSSACFNFLTWLRAIADSYSAEGAPRRAETFAACEDLIAFCDRFSDFCDERCLLEFKRIGYLLKAQNHIRDGSYEEALDDIEVLTEVIERYFKFDASESESIYYDSIKEIDEYFSKERHGRWFATALTWAVSDFADKTGNPVVTSDRYKACVERVEKLL